MRRLSPRRRKMEAVARPPTMPRTLNPTAAAYNCTRDHNVPGGFKGSKVQGSCSRRRHVPAPRPNDVVRVFDLDTNHVPAAVLLVAGRRIAEEVLLAQLVGDARGGAVEIAWLPD